jgi:hypothetical protein
MLSRLINTETVLLVSLLALILFITNEIAGIGAHTMARLAILN